jgi:hypothetical protein
MGRTKEENTIYMKAYYERNKQKMIDNAKANYENNKDVRKAYIKKWQDDNPEIVKGYSQKPERVKYNRIRAWKRQGIIVPNDDWEKFYNYYLEINNCNYCKVKLTYDLVTTRTQKHVHHDHDINDKPNVVCICCAACNSERKQNNTSGEVNIIFNKRDNTWTFQKLINGTIYSRSSFKTKQEAIDYKIKFLADLTGV